jgi:hypothetical protein
LQYLKKDIRDETDGKVVRTSHGNRYKHKFFGEGND